MDIIGNGFAPPCPSNFFVEEGSSYICADETHITDQSNECVLCLNKLLLLGSTARYLITGIEVSVGLDGRFQCL